MCNKPGETREAAESPALRERAVRGLGRLLLTVGIVLAGAGLACDGSSYGVGSVGAGADGRLIAHALFSQFGPHDIYQSDDGGLSWRYVGESTLHSTSPYIGMKVTTPRGDYQIVQDEYSGTDIARLDAEIVRTVDGRKETVFPVRQLLDNANIKLQQQTRWGPETQLYRIHYDAASENIIAAMGTQGVVVGTPEERWLRVGVGDFVPTDFSVEARTRLLATTPSLWVTLLAMIALSSAFPFVLATCRRREITWVVIIASGAFAAASALYFAVDWEPLAAGLLRTLVALVVELMALALFLARDSQSPERRSMALAVAGLVLAGVIAVFPGFTGLSLLGLLWFPPIFLLVGLPTLLLAAVAVWPHPPSGWEWRAIGISSAIMLPALTVPVALWMQYILTYQTAKAISIGLAAAIAIALFVWLKWRKRQTWSHS